jgi:hypothetical protein
MYKVYAKKDQSNEECFLVGYFDDKYVAHDFLRYLQLKVFFSESGHLINLKDAVIVNEDGDRK